jgi:hypothetical protein
VKWSRRRLQAWTTSPGCGDRLFENELNDGCQLAIERLARLLVAREVHLYFQYSSTLTPPSSSLIRAL